MSEKSRVTLPSIHFYVDDSKESKEVLKLVEGYSVQYAIHREVAPKHDGKKNRPYMIIGDPDGTPLGPTSNFTAMKNALEVLSKA